MCDRWALSTCPAGLQQHHVSIVVGCVCPRRLLHGVPPAGIHSAQIDKKGEIKSDHFFTYDCSVTKRFSFYNLFIILYSHHQFSVIQLDHLYGVDLSLVLLITTLTLNRLI